MDLQKIKDGVVDRLEFRNHNDEAEYQSAISKVNNSYPDEGSIIPAGYTAKIKNLKKNKLQKIRTDLNDDVGFYKLYNELHNLRLNKAKKEADIRNLTKPNAPNFRQKLYSFVYGKNNSAEYEIAKFNNATTNLRLEINELDSIISNLEMLKCIYTE